jgi:phospholipase C
MWIWMENHGYGSVIGSASAPFENQVAAQCGLATNYHNITHPSLPNYIAATSGLALSQLGAFSSDCDPSAACSAGAGVASIFSQEPSWKAYEESMPYPCAKGSSDDYAARHNPPVYYQSLARTCTANDVGIADLNRDLATGSLPAFSFVTPNLVDDTHNATVADGDRWLRSTLGTITASNEYRSGTLAVFVVWDEGEGGGASDCATNTTDAGCHVPALVLSASTRPATSIGALFSHYSLLRTAEELLGLPPLGQATDTASMAPAFGLTG